MALTQAKVRQMKQIRKITAADIVDRETYGRERQERRQHLSVVKRSRRLRVGPDAVFLFENSATMLAQVQEMLWIENGGDEQLADELAAYNPLIPQGQELVATLMLDFPNPAKRDRELRRLGGIENLIHFKIGEFTVSAIPDVTDGVERTKDDGKTSAIHFLHFPFTAEQIAAFRDECNEVVLAIGHENYGHMAILPIEIRKSLAEDFA